MEEIASKLRVLLATVGIGILLLGFLTKGLCRARGKLPPAVPGLPIVGNLLQLKDKKPHRTFTQWARKYGPIYSIRTGAASVVVLSSSELAREAMVTKFSSISTRKLPNALNILTRRKTMIAMSDYGDYHRMVKKLILTNLLGPAAQKQKHIRFLRERMVQRMVDQIYSEIESRGSSEVLNVREIFITELFPLALLQVLGRDVESLYVEEMESTLTRWQIFEILVTDPLKGAIEVDWRDFFPYLRWIPFNSVEENMRRFDGKRSAVMRALIRDQKKLLASGKEPNCFLDIVLKEAQHMTDEQLEMLTWEPIIESSDTTLVTVEWAMFELSKNPAFQDRLYRELQKVCGDETVTEDHFPNLPFLNAVFHETLRKHPPVSILPLRYVHEDVQLGGFDVPAGWQIAINIYGCHNDEKEWKNPEEWNPERFLGEDGREQTLLDVHCTMGFGAGKRACAGVLQAMLIACTAIGRFVQGFKWELSAGEEEEGDNTVTLTTHKLRPLKAIVTPRTPTGSEELNLSGDDLYGRTMERSGLA